MRCSPGGLMLHRRRRLDVGGSASSRRTRRRVRRDESPAYEAPADAVRGEIFNVLHSNYQIRELAMLVAAAVPAHRPQRRARRGRSTEADPATTSATNAKTGRRRSGFIPRHSVLEAVTNLLEKIESSPPAELNRSTVLQHSAGSSSCNELKPALESFPSVL